MLGILARAYLLASLTQPGQIMTQPPQRSDPSQRRAEDRRWTRF